MIGGKLFGMFVVYVFVKDTSLLNHVLFFFLDEKETKNQGWESSAVNLSSNFWKKITPSGQTDFLPSEDALTLIAEI